MTASKLPKCFWVKHLRAAVFGNRIRSVRGVLYDRALRHKRVNNVLLMLKPFFFIYLLTLSQADTITNS